jgi:hypothetical protein
MIVQIHYIKLRNFIMIYKKLGRPPQSSLLPLTADKRERRQLLFPPLKGDKGGWSKKSCCKPKPVTLLKPPSREEVGFVSLLEEGKRGMKQKKLLQSKTGYPPQSSLKGGSCICFPPGGGIKGDKVKKVVANQNRSPSSILPQGRKLDLFPSWSRDKGRWLFPAFNSIIIST